MSVPDDLDNEVQLEPPQQTIRAEAPDTDRQERELTNGEARVLIHSVTAMAQKQIDAAAEVTDSITRLKTAETQAKAWSLTRRHSETGTWKADQNAYVAHHRAGTNGEAADDALLARRPRLKPWMYWSLQTVLVVADFMFFLYLWRDVEEATSWLSVKTLQAAVYALITPVALQTIAYGLGRVVATWLRKGRNMASAERTLLIMLGVAGIVAVLTIVFGVMQRMTMHEGIEGAVSVNPALFYTLFLILPLGLGLAEVLKHDEAVALDELRSAANTAAAHHVNGIVEAGTRQYDAWVDAYDQVTRLRDVLRLEMQEPLFAAADLIAQERAHHGHDGPYANLLWSGTPGPYTGSGWVDVGLPSGAFDPVIDGPTPRVSLDRVQRLDAAMKHHRPPPVSEWMVTIARVLVPAPDAEADEKIDDQSDPDDDVSWERELVDGFDDVLDENDPKVDNR